MYPGRIRRYMRVTISLLKVRERVMKGHGGPGKSRKQRESSVCIRVFLKDHANFWERKHLGVF
jgi:hypothetical protein